MTSAPLKEFVPDRKYKVVLSEKLETSSSDYLTASIQLQPELKLPQIVKSASISPGFNSDDCRLSLTSAADGKESIYPGKRNAAGSCALIYDHANGIFVLERIDTQFAFAADNRSDSEEQTEAAMLSALIEEEGAAKPDNPFDWRHQLQRARSPTPDLDNFRLDTGPDPSPAQSPESKPFKSRTRHASSPPAMSMDFDEPSPPHGKTPQRDEFEIGGEDDSDDEGGGLQISYEGASKPRGFRGRHPQVNGAPTSLRSAANSQSPAILRHRTPESDEDIEQIRLGSPLKTAQSSTEPDPEELELEAALREAEAEADEIDDMEAEIQRHMEGNDEEDVPAPVPTYMDESSEESEEE